MKKALLLIFIFSYSFLSAQVTLSLTAPSESTVALSSEVDVVAKGMLKNDSDDTLTVMWKRNIIELTEGWATAVCDKNLCYIPSFGETSEETGTNLILLPGEESNFDIHVYPNGTEGAAIVELTATDVNNSENTVTGRYEFNQTTTSTRFVSKSNIKIYPNPTSQYISLTDATNVDRLMVYNIVGRPVKTFRATSSNQYDVSNLPIGIYLVRLVDQYDYTLKTVRLRVNYP